MRFSFEFLYFNKMQINLPSISRITYYRVDINSQFRNCKLRLPGKPGSSSALQSSEFSVYLNILVFYALIDTQLPVLDFPFNSLDSFR